MNVFRKCMERQMGIGKYHKYIETCRSSFSKEGVVQFAHNSKPIYDDMYELLKRENEVDITERLSDMLSTLKAAFRITRYFALVFIAYIAGNIALISMELDYRVTCVSILLMGICFLYKLVEFVCNKYCVLDAYLFMIYKSVLEKIAKESL